MDGIELKPTAELAEVCCPVTLVDGLIVVLPVVPEVSVDELRIASPVAVDILPSELIEVGGTVVLIDGLRDVDSSKDSLLLNKLLEVPLATDGAGIVLDELLELNTGTAGSTAVNAVISNVRPPQ